MKLTRLNCFIQTGLATLAMAVMTGCQTTEVHAPAPTAAATVKAAPKKPAPTPPPAENRGTTHSGILPEDFEAAKR